MVRRTTSTLVQKISGIASSVDLDGFIDTASMMVDKVDAADSAGDLDEQQLELIERWLAAHFAVSTVARNRVVTSKSIGGASESYGGGAAGSNLQGTEYGRTAIALDTTSFLNSMYEGSPSLFWLGTEDED